MSKFYAKLVLLLLTCLLGCIPTAEALVKGIYLTQSSLENTAYLNYLIQHAKAVGITTFVVDLEHPTKKYQANIPLLKKNNITYVARIVVFPDGGLPEQIASQAYWEKRYKLIESAVGYGAQQIQLDYIRYNTKQPGSPQNAKNVVKVIQWYKNKLAPLNIPLQADVFGIASFGESKYIGQNLKLIGPTVDALCPMVYPSHFEPFRVHAVTPYKTIYDSLKAIHAQFNNHLTFKLYAYIELSNYRYPLSPSKRHAYIMDEMRAVKDGGGDGWYAWSAHNRYDYLFSLLGEMAKEEKPDAPKTVEAKITPPKVIPTPPTPPKSISLNDDTDTLLFSWPLTARYFVY